MFNSGLYFTNKKNEYYANLLKQCEIAQHKRAQRIAEYTQQLYIVQENLRKEIAEKVYDACKDTCNSSDVEALDVLCSQDGGKVVVNFFKNLHLFRLSCEAASLSPEVINRLMISDIYSEVSEECKVQANNQENDFDVLRSCLTDPAQSELYSSDVNKSLIRILP